MNRDDYSIPDLKFRVDGLVEELALKEKDEFLKSMKKALKTHIGREPEMSDFAKCRLVYSNDFPAEPKAFTYKGRTLVKFEHTSGFVNNEGEVTYKHETKIVYIAPPQRPDVPPSKPDKTY